MKNRRQKIVAVDAMNLLYHAARHTGSYLEEKKEGFDAVVETCQIVLGQFEEVYQAQAVMVLDGRAPQQKKAELRIRKEKRDAARAVADAAIAKARDDLWAEKKKSEPSAHRPSRKEACGDLGIKGKNRVKVLLKDSKDPGVQEALNVTDKGGETTVQEVVRESVKVTEGLKWKVVKELRNRGFRYKIAPGEAEAQAAWWSMQKIATVVVTRDWDAFLFGAHRVARDFHEPGKVTTLGYAHGCIRASGREQMVEAHILAGKTDYAPALPGVGSIRHALNLMSATGGFQATVESRAPGVGDVWYEAKVAYMEPRVCRCGRVVSCECAPGSETIVGVRHQGESTGAVPA